MNKLCSATTVATVIAAATIAGALVSPPPKTHTITLRTAVPSTLRTPLSVELRSVKTSEHVTILRSSPSSGGVKATLRGRIDYGALPGLPDAVPTITVRSSGSPERRRASNMTSFDLPNIEPGIARIRATGPGFVAESHSIRLDPGATVEPIVLVAEAAYSIRGMVKRNGPPAPLRVSWARNEFVSVARDGSFEIHGLSPGRYPLRLAQRVRDRPQDGAEEWMTTSLGAVDAVIEDSDAAVLMIEERGHRLVVELWSPGRGAVDGVRLLIEREGDTGTALASAVTDAEGRAEFAGLARSRGSSLQIGVPFVEPVELSIPTSPYQTLPYRVSMPLLGSIVCRVVDEAGAPVANVPLSLARGEKVAPLAITDERGYAIGWPVPTGQYRLVVSERRLPTPIDIEPGRTTEIEVALTGRELSVIAGSVTQKGGAPVPGAAVRISRHGVGVAITAAQTDKDGQFEFRVPGSGAFDVVARYRRGVSASWARKRDLEHGARAELRLAPTGSIRSAVPAGATAILWLNSVEIDRSRDDSARGQIIFENVDPGHYRVSLEHDDKRVELVVGTDSETRIDLKTR